jgi:hypothetical protein
MTTRIESGGPTPGVSSTSTAPRVTPTPERPFKNVMAAGARAVVRGAEAAVERLPGGPILAAALRPSAPPLGGGGLTAVSANNTPEGSGGSAGPAGASSASDAGLDGVMAQHADLNMQYLALQEQINAESREYSTISNVLKARHDTIKNAIGNIR